MGYVWEDDFIAESDRVNRELVIVHRKARRMSFILLIMSLFLIAVIHFQAISNKAELQVQVDRLSKQLTQEITWRRTIDDLQSSNFVEITKNSNRVNDRLKSFDMRIASLANDLDQQCTIHSDDYYRTCAKLDALQEDNLRQEECIKGLFHNFDVVWEWFALDSKRLDDLASMLDSCHTRPCPALIQRKTIRHRR